MTNLRFKIGSLFKAVSRAPQSGANDGLAASPSSAGGTETDTHPLSRRVGWRATDSGWTYDRTADLVSGHYRMIDRATAESDRNDAWHFPDVARQQHDAYLALLADLDRGQIRTDFAVAAAAVERTALPELSLLEIGCGSGYYSDVFAKLVPGRVRYTGVDLSTSMVEIANATFADATFEVADAQSLPFPMRASTSP